ncbi:hypothetical protein T265_12846, partial [Opisthorchis viverrini]
VCWRLLDTKCDRAPASIRDSLGSILRPPLFLMYVSVPSDILASSFLLLADEMKSWSSNPSVPSSGRRLDKAVVVEKALPLVEDKCVHMSFGGDSVNALFMPGENGPETITRVDAK